MTAEEARNKSLWNNLPKIIQVKITDTINIGSFKCCIYRSIDPDVFKITNIVRDILIELGYSIDIRTFTINNEEDRKIEIRW